MSGVGCRNLQVDAGMLHGVGGREGGHPHLQLIQEPPRDISENPSSPKRREEKDVLCRGSGSRMEPSPAPLPHSTVTQIWSHPAQACAGSPDAPSPYLGLEGTWCGRGTRVLHGAAVQHLGCGSSGASHPLLSQSPICCHHRL